MDINDFCLMAIEISEKRLAALEVAKLALRQYASGGRSIGCDCATYALRRITELEKEIE